MGRTVPTYRQTLESIIREWSDFRRGLTEEDREVFDRLMNRARSHASAATYAAFPNPVEAVLLSIILEQEKTIMELKEEVEGG